MNIEKLKQLAEHDPPDGKPIGDPDSVMMRAVRKLLREHKLI